jgi:protein-disulfide isomerase
LTTSALSALLIQMPARKTPSEKKPKTAKFSQTQILYALLLAAAFLVGYLLATVQALQKPQNQNTGAAPQAQAPEPPTVNPDEALKKLGKARLPVKGSADAKVAIVEFSDFECPFCASFYKETLPKIISEYVDKGLVKVDYRHYPLSFHPQALPSANAAECANEQGKFWEMHDKIFSENVGGALGLATVDTYKTWAQELGLEASVFDSCLDEQRYKDIIDSDFALGNELVVNATPTFFINGKQLVGAQPFESFKAIIDEELK